MINGLNTNLDAGKLADMGGAGASQADFKPINGPSFADTLKASVDEVSRMQQDASKAVDDIASGKTDDVNHVMTAVEKSDLAFKTLLAIRSKLMDAYEEIKGIAI